LQEIAQALSRKKIGTTYRRQLLDNVLPYIESGNAGLDDDLYDMVYAACYTDDEWRALAEAFETKGGDWKIDHARRIYRQLGVRRAGGISRSKSKRTTSNPAFQEEFTKAVPGWQALTQHKDTLFGNGERLRYQPYLPDCMLFGQVQ
jgi:hypothetical protein